MKRKSLWGFAMIIMLASIFFTGCKEKDGDKENEVTNIITENNKDNNDSNDNDNTPSPSPSVQNEASNSNEYQLTIHVDQKGVDIGDLMYGLFYEDINFAADGGLYAEMINNRSFEFQQGKASYGALHGYKSFNNATLEVMNETPLNENNPNYVTITNSESQSAGLINTGFLEGMVIEKKEYRFSVYLKSDSYQGSITVSLINKEDEVLAEEKINLVTKDWVKYELTLSGKEDAVGAQLLLALDEEGSIEADMMSLFPKDTYKNRVNGLRADLVEMLADLNPSFIRFPGGCVVEGDSLKTAYSWKDTVGDVAQRKQNTNLWHSNSSYPYYQSYGLGFYEYFLLCEDLGAAPIPILNCGMACQARTNSVATMEELDQYIQDALDLIEFANGSVDTQWGALRAEMGHEEPFNMEYLGIGNEQWDSVYFARYEKFKEVLRERYPEIKLITTSGPHSGGGLYEYAWNRILSHKNDDTLYADLVDEHYYNAPEWFLQNVYRYDSYDREGAGVFLGEYAAKANNLYAAIAEAAYMTGLERNADVVKMAAYAPLFGNLTSSQWTPDLIWFNNSKAFGSVNYYVQKMFAGNVGDYTVKSSLSGDVSKSAISGRIGLGTWLTSARFDDVRVVDNVTGEVLYENNFDERGVGWTASSQGDWKIVDEQGNNVFAQQNATYPSDGSIMGSAIYYGDLNWSNYTFTCRAKKVSGAEGFLIPFAMKDFNNFYYWNIGGWGNSLSAIEQAQGGTKATIGESARVNILAARWYDIKVVVGIDTIECYLNDQLMHTIVVSGVLPVYETVSIDESTGDMIVKVVNATEEEAIIHVTLDGLNGKTIANEATLELLSGASKAAQNSLSNPENVVSVLKNMEINMSNDTDVSQLNTFDYPAPAYSVSIIRIPME